MIRESNIFGGLPITGRLEDAQRRGGVVAVDLQAGRVIGSMEFEAGCAELFDIQVLPGMRFPTVVGFQDQTLDGILIAPPAAWQADATSAG